ncbi:YfkD family protein [Geomicrobium sp. JSM 1781026]|uniref:YfkD family protein n=1 Tax=Geomicrobium sp. JSM 1781026 TaxID=3344580 RepID=UPI0035C07E98
MKPFLCAAVGVILSSLVMTPLASAAEDVKDESFDKPEYVYSISRENTHENMTRELPYLQPAELTTRLQETSDVIIDNPSLISLLNESSIKDSKLAFGVNASIYLGPWALTYESDETTMNWEYDLINTNELDNRGGDTVGKLSYTQTENKLVEGELSSPVPQQEDVQNMMRIKATEKTSLPLSFHANIGNQTTAGPMYQVQPDQKGVVTSYVPAVHDQGTVTYGEVYVTIKGSKPAIVIKNIQEQQVDGWIPVKDYVTLKYHNG